MRKCVVNEVKPPQIEPMLEPTDRKVVKGIFEFRIHKLDNWHYSITMYCDLFKDTSPLICYPSMEIKELETWEEVLKFLDLFNGYKR